MKNKRRTPLHAAAGLRGSHTIPFTFVDNLSCQDKNSFVMTNSKKVTKTVGYHPFLGLCLSLPNPKTLWDMLLICSDSGSKWVGEAVQYIVSS